MQRLGDISEQSSIEARREAVEAGLVTEATPDAKRTRDWFHDTEQRAYRLKYANELAYQTESGRKQAEAEYLGREAPFTQMELQGRATELNEKYGTLFADYGNLRKLVLLARKSRAELTKHELAFLEKTVALEILNAAQDPEGINGNLQEAARAILADKNAWQANPFASGAVDAAIINIYQRLIDPGVSVRQSEFDVHIEGVSYGQQAKQFVRGEWVRVREFIPPNVRASMLGSADLMMQTHMSFYIAERVPIDLAIHVGKYNPALFSPNWIPRLFGEKSEEARALRGQIPALLGVGGNQLEEWEWNPSHPEYYTKGLSRYKEELLEREEETDSPSGTEEKIYTDPDTGKIY